MPEPLLAPEALGLKLPGPLVLSWIVVVSVTILGFATAFSRFNKYLFDSQRMGWRSKLRIKYSLVPTLALDPRILVLTTVQSLPIQDTLDLHFPEALAGLGCNDDQEVNGSKSFMSGRGGIRTPDLQLRRLPPYPD